MMMMSAAHQKFIMPVLECVLIRFVGTFVTFPAIYDVLQL
jgi:hypothetical protein